MVFSVSFGQKIPVAKYKVIDLYKNANVDAVLYEFDGKDKDDVKYFKKLGDRWSFKNFLYDDIRGKFDSHNQKYKEDAKINTSIYEKLNLYAAEIDCGKTIGICQTDDYSSAVEMIESSKCGLYKYSGQTMLAALGKMLINKSPEKELKIMFPSVKAMPFYIKKCGFKEPDEKEADFLFMKKNEIEQFIKEVESKTGGRIIDLSV